MKHIILLLILAFFFASCCKKDDNSINEIPQCIKDNYQLSSNSELVVKQWEKDGTVFYFFNTGAVAYDGAESIFNASCENVCGYCGFCIEKDCINDFPEYNSSDWVKVLPE